MPNIRISALPPAVLPLDDPNTFFEVTVFEAGEEVSRKITLSDIATSTGLDASFLTLSVNAQLPNERVLTEGANVTFVDSGPNGTLTISVSGAAFGDVFKVGTPVDNEIGVWTGDGTIEGDPNFTWDGSQFLLPLENVPAAPTLAFGDGDTGFFQPLDDNLQVSLVGVSRFFWELDSFNAVTGTGPAMRNEAVSATNPTFTPRRSDPDTGLGSNTLNEPSLIGGGVELARGVAAASGGLLVNNTLTGAGLERVLTTSDAGGGNVIKVGTPVDNQVGVWTGDGTIEGDPRFIWTGSRLELFGSGLSNRMRMEHDDTDFNMTAINGGAFIIDGLGDGIDIESNASSPAGNVYFRMHGDADNASDFNVARFVNDNAGDAGGTRIDIIGQRDTVAGLVRILHSGANHLGTPITSGPTGTVGGIGTQGAAIPFSLFTNLTERMRIEGTGEVGIRHGNVLAIYDATDADSLKWSHDGVDGLLATVGTGDLNITGLSGRIMQDAETLAFVSEIVVPDPLLLSDGSAAAPSYSFTSDTDIGMFRVGADILGLSARATLIAQAVGALGANQFVVAPGAVQNNVSAPDLGFGDGDTGVMQTVDDTVALVAGANLAVRYAEASGSIIQTNSSDVALTASVTQTQVGGLALLDSYNEIATVANEGDALTAFDVFQGSRLIVINNGANGLQLFPASGDNFGAGVDASVTISANSVGVFLGRDSTNWDPLQNQSASGSVFQGLGIWRYRTETTSPPATGQVRFNNADPTLATEMFLAETNSNGTDVNNFLNLMTPGSVFYIQDKGTAANFFLVEISSNVDNGTDRTFGIANITLQGVEPSQNAEVLIIASEAGPVPTVNDAVQARRTTGYVLTTAFVDVTMDVTDVETDDAVLNHDLVTNTDNIIAVVAGTYAISYQFNISNASAVNTIIEAQARVRLNDAGTGIPGSLASTFNMRNHGTQLPTHLSCDFIVTLAASDFITLQAQKIELDDVQVYTIDEVSVKATRLL